MVQKMNSLGSIHNFNSRSSIELYENLNESTQSVVDLIRNAANNIISNDEITNEQIDISNEGGETWYSYTIETNSPEFDSLSLNKKFISYCIDNGLHHVLNSNITFRFTLGKRNANKYTKPSEYFEGIIK
ncbi:hypothetical protein [Legionella septentrionalis]|uniref:hypothetical protein n=1 Tax=Legionella septentrionalis TaxID=2498109 RepID=UPI000F8CB3F3|nr:hypothetical protein [Legionella septentrionalis]RUR15624.1 hypothetical protein ELY10_05365 [Legionella septentrionalis]